MSDYGFLVGPYFLGFAVIAMVLGLIAAWSGRATWLRAIAIALVALMAYLSFVAIDDLLSRPKPMTFAELQAELPDGHPGHLVLYGETTKGGIYLLLRSPSRDEPRYVLMPSSEKDQETFQEAQRIAKKKGTQLLLGGKPKDGQKDGKNGKGKGRGTENVDMDAVFHPAPVSGGPEKDMTSPGEPMVIPTPSPGGVDDDL
ncbi:MAG: hypothetical protein Q7S52_02700 [bacterium]|nr:hypothetical protein [bacterium]